MNQLNLINLFVHSFTQHFQSFLLKFQSNEPLIHLPYSNMCRLISSIMSKFIRKKYLSQVDSENIIIDLSI